MFHEGCSKTIPSDFEQRKNPIQKQFCMIRPGYREARERQKQSTNF